MRKKNYNEAIKQIHINAIFTAVLHGHGCGCRCPTRVRVSDLLEFLGTRQITLGIRHGCGVSDSAKKLRHGCQGNTDDGTVLVPHLSSKQRPCRTFFFQQLGVPLVTATIPKSLLYLKLVLFLSTCSLFYPRIDFKCVILMLSTLICCTC